jgi:tetratricopeptide (TPR) repeat protein
LSAVGVAALLLALAPLAREGQAQPEPTVEAAAPTAEETERRERAKAHFKQGDAAFARGEYRDALMAYTRAYETLPLPGFLFNIGQCHRNLGAHERAIYSFKLYLRQAPEASNRKAVETLIRELEEVVAQQRTAPPDVDGQPKWGASDDKGKGGQTAVDLAAQKDAASRRDEAKPFYKTWWFWTAVGAVVVGAAAAGVYFGTRSETTLPYSPLPPWQLP